MKVRSLDELEDILDQDLSWRRKEFTTLRLMIQSSRNHQKRILMRAGIALMYSHWEGHIKKSAEAYLCYLNCIAPKYSSMSDNFSHLSLGDKFFTGFSIKKYSSQKEIFDYIQSGLDSKFSVDEQKVINTESNLKSQVLMNILNQLGLDTNSFQLKENFIDSIMLKNRNKIAHGEHISDADLTLSYSEIEKELLAMIEKFQNQVRNAAANKSYLKNDI